MIRIRPYFRARSTFGGIHLNWSKRGLSSVSATIGPHWLPVTVNPTRRSVSIDTPGPGSLRLVASGEPDAPQGPSAAQRAGAALGRAVAHALFH